MLREQTHGAAEYRCSFCGRLREEVEHLFGGANRAYLGSDPVYICTVCIDHVNQLLEEERRQRAAFERRSSTEDS